MFVLKTESVNSGYPVLLNELLKKGVNVSPRGKETWEISPACWTIENPRKRSCEVMGRWKNLGFQLAECLWILAGMKELRMLQHYVPYYWQFSDDMETLSGAYGDRLRHWRGADGSEIDQLQCVYEKLQHDNDSRQGVMIIFNPSLDYKKTLDVPCTNWFHFTIRDKKLNLTVVMRSNDAIWGTPYNMFNFMTIQEVMAGWLGVEMGEYRHIVDCLHIYKDKLDVLKRINYQILKNIDIYDFYKPLDARLPKFDFDLMLRHLIEEEFSSRKRYSRDNISHIMQIPRGYWRDYAWAIVADNIMRWDGSQPLEIIKMIGNEFRYSLIQKLCRMSYRAGRKAERDKKILELLEDTPPEVRKWALENPNKEKLHLEEGNAKV